MKKFLIIIFLILTFSFGKGQPMKKEFLNYYLQLSNDKNSTYIKEVYKTDSGFRVLVLTNPNCELWKNKKQEQVYECSYKSLSPIIEDGVFKANHFIGQFQNGEMTGIWYKTDTNEKIIDTLDYSFILTDHKYINKKDDTTNKHTMEYDFSINNILISHLLYPPRSIYYNEQGKVLAEIQTNLYGEIEQIIIKQSVSKDIDKEVVRVILKYFPKVKQWKGIIPFNFKIK